MATATAPLPTQIQTVTRGINPWVVALTVTIATFMELLDTSIANVSLPYIAGGLGRSYDEVTWILTTYLVANAVVLPMSAWLSRVFGRKNYYMACVALFTATSFLCGVAPTLGIMLIARVMQGIGGGGLAPVEQAIWWTHFRRRRGLRRSRCIRWRLLRRRPLGQCWAGGSRITTIGGGCF
jgi:DHA2 family multidrug resistance protein